MGNLKYYSLFKNCGAFLAFYARKSVLILGTSVTCEQSIGHFFILLNKQCSVRN